VAVVTLAELLGQPDAQEQLRRSVASGRYANAYLFHGPPGVGKGTAALAFARAILCEPRGVGAPADQLEGHTDVNPPAVAGDACGACGACHKTAALQHPDLKFLFPVSGEEKELEKTIVETLESWRQDPLFVFTYD